MQSDHCCVACVEILDIYNTTNPLHGIHINCLTIQPVEPQSQATVLYMYNYNVMLHILLCGLNQLSSIIQLHVCAM